MTAPSRKPRGWWIERVREEYGEQASVLLDHGNARAPLTLRVNPRVTTRTAFIAALQAAGVQPVLLPGSVYALGSPPDSAA